MIIPALTRSEVLTRTSGLPAFPVVVNKILSSLDDPEANLNVLADFIGYDPVITARVLSFANRAADRTRNIASVRDIYTATSLIGMSHVREIVLVSSLGQFANDKAMGQLSSAYWQHSVAVAVCAQELALHITAPVVSDLALIAGLLHDVGQLWLYRFYPAEFEQAIALSVERSIGTDVAEREIFGLDHTVIGAWLAEYWGLPSGVATAIRCHHQPDAALDDLIVPVVSVAEVLSNALDLAGRSENRVTQISSAACNALGLVFDADIQPLFGRIEARSKYANALFMAQ